VRLLERYVDPGVDPDPGAPGFAYGTGGHPMYSCKAEKRIQIVSPAAKERSGGGLPEEERIDPEVALRKRDVQAEAGANCALRKRHGKATLR
jgi:hypothetical protein